MYIHTVSLYIYIYICTHTLTLKNTLHNTITYGIPYNTLSNAPYIYSMLCRIPLRKLIDYLVENPMYIPCMKFGATERPFAY